ncbi:MAG: 3-deoxy-D-manno-octulosonic acid transferase, partial [Nanoarchaeota archaeon]
IVYFPLDLSFAVNRAVKTINPDLVIIMETELWPNFIKYAKNNNSKLMFANGRISKKSFKFYKFLDFFLKDMLNKVDCFSMQSKKDLERIIELGAKKEIVFNSGNTKFDQTYANIDQDKVEIYQKQFQLDDHHPILVAGSTHDDEEKKLIDIYKRLKRNYEDLLFILAPRHVKRADDIQKMYEKRGISTIKRTEIDSKSKTNEDV